jgi:hypothetical protein
MKPITPRLAKWAQSEFNRRGGKLQAVILDPVYPADGVCTFIVSLRKQRSSNAYFGIELGTGKEYKVTALGEFVEVRSLASDLAEDR